MKTKLIPQLTIAASVALATSAFAGTSEPVSSPAPIQETASLCQWFIGLGYGQLSGVDSNLGDALNEIPGVDAELDFDMYSLQLGRSFGSEFAGFTTAAYLEVAYFDGDADVTYDGNGLGLGADVDIIPVTLNLMAERNLFGGLGIYLGGGLGYAFSDSDFLDYSDSDGGFYAQATFGLSYNFTESFELFGGGRWVYLGDVGIGDSDIELDDALGWEVGIRVNF